MGAIITPRNRDVYFQRYKEDYLKRINNSGNPDKYNDRELNILARGYALSEIKREKNHLKAYLKGHQYYKVYGQTYPVLTPELFQQQAQMMKNQLLNKEEEE